MPRAATTRKRSPSLRWRATKNDPRILRITGFATRKLGDVDGAMPYYQRALGINPNDTLTREYMGEAFLTKGDMTSANAQLGEIEKRCGTACEDYAKLAEAIASAGQPRERLSSTGLQTQLLAGRPGCDERLARPAASLLVRLEDCSDGLGAPSTAAGARSVTWAAQAMMGFSR